MDEKNQIVTIPPFPKNVSFWSLCCFVPYQVLAWDEMPTVSAGEEMEFNKNGYQFFTVPASGFYTIKVEDDIDGDYNYGIRSSSTIVWASQGVYNCCRANHLSFCPIDSRAKTECGLVMI